MVLFRVKTPSDEGDKIGISVFDSELTRLWTRKVTLPYPTKKIRAEDFLINNEGTFFMTASIFAEESSDKDKLKETYRTGRHDNHGTQRRTKDGQKAAES